MITRAILVAVLFDITQHVRDTIIDYLFSLVYPLSIYITLGVSSYTIKYQLLPTCYSSTLYKTNNLIIIIIFTKEFGIVDPSLCEPFETNP